MTEIQIELEAENSDLCRHCGADIEEHCRDCNRCDDGGFYSLTGLPKFICESCVLDLETESKMEYDSNLSIDRWIIVAEIKAGRR